MSDLEFIVVILTGVSCFFIGVIVGYSSRGESDG